MIIKKEIYPKTQRVKVKNSVVITEKMDGSNLGIFRRDGKLWICTRAFIFSLDDLQDKEVNDCITSYKGLYLWLEEHGEDLKNNLNNGSGFFGEWMGSSGHVSYPAGIREYKIYMFAKARLEEDESGFHARNIMYDHTLFGYIFEDGILRDYINVVPIVKECETVPSLEELNELYDEYTSKVGRNVEGFVINFYDNIRKYVRMKSGHLEDHHE